MIKFLIIISALIVFCRAERIKCNSTLVWNGCPNQSSCSSEINECICDKGLTFNNKWDSSVSGTSYCVQNQKYVADENLMSMKSPSNQLIQPPGSHHIIGGILIPILIVFLAVGLILGIKKLRVIQRIREMITRKQRPSYEDVIMGNDLDDPPLI